jgi:ATP-dependent Clp protease ATP-binding subunit ClpC
MESKDNFGQGGEEAARHTRVAAMHLSFNDAARLALRLAQHEARRLQHDSVGTEHLLLALLNLHGCIAARVLGKARISLDRILVEVEKLVPFGSDSSERRRSLTQGCRTAIALAVAASERLGHARLGTGHLLLGLLEEAEGVAFRVLCKLGIGRLGRNLSRVAEHIIVEMNYGRWPKKDWGKDEESHLDTPDP